MPDFAKRWLEKDRSYWFWAVFIIVVASTGSSYVYDYLHVQDARTYLFQRMLSWGRQPVEPRRIKVVLIQDDEYWLGPLAGRRPIKRDYLARMVDKLVELNAHVIALDFDVRLPNPVSMEIPPEYRAETQKLIDAIKRAASLDKKVILAVPVSGKDEPYRRDSDIYQASGLCISRDGVAPNAKGTNPIECGYIALPYDPLALPNQLRMTDGTLLDSFSLAIARADRPTSIDRLIKRMGTEVRYSNFIPHDVFETSGSELSARALLNGEIDKSDIDSKIIIVGANWSRDAANRGPLVDLHWTPVGQIVGAELHANYAEAFLEPRVFGSAPGWVLHLVEIVFSILAALAFAAIPSRSGKVAGLMVAILLLFLATWEALRFGLFFDAFVPIIGLGVHSLIESFFGSEETGHSAANGH
jgi:CHASE2 domain-containing sensor protein